MMEENERDPVTKIHITNEEEEIIISGEDIAFFPIWKECRRTMIRQIEKKIFDPNFTIESFSYKKGDTCDTVG